MITLGRRESYVIVFVFVAILLVFQLNSTFKQLYHGAPLQPVDDGGNDGHSATPSRDQLTMESGRVGFGQALPPSSKILQHAPGYTIFEDVYMLNGTVYIVSEAPEAVPPIRMMTSSGYGIFDSQEDLEKREPTDKDMQVITPQRAQEIFGKAVNRLGGTTFIANDPGQFMSHYYHFTAETLLGLWRAYTSLDSNVSSSGRTSLPPPRRLIFPHISSDKWKDQPKMNPYVFHGAFPEAALELQEDWEDRAGCAVPWMFERVVFNDRSAAIRGERWPVTQRMVDATANMPGGGKFWLPVRDAVAAFSGVDVGSWEVSQQSPVITYVSRQGWGRRMLRQEDHERLVNALRRLEREYGWEVNVVKMDELTRAEQIRLASRTTVMMGVHGNGLTALLWMNPTPQTTVIEFFCPGGFTYDYHWTATAIGMTHYAFWNDTYHTSGNLPPIALPEQFHGNDIPLDGEVVAALVVRSLTLHPELDD